MAVVFAPTVPLVLLSKVVRRVSSAVIAEELVLIVPSALVTLVVKPLIAVVLDAVAVSVLFISV